MWSIFHKLEVKHLIARLDAIVEGAGPKMRDCGLSQTILRNVTLCVTEMFNFFFSFFGKSVLAGRLMILGPA